MADWGFGPWLNCMKLSKANGYGGIGGKKTDCGEGLLKLDGVNL